MSRWLPFRRDLGLQVLALYLLCVGPVIAALLFDTSACARLEGDGHAAELACAPDVQALETGCLALLFAAVSAAQPEINLVYVNDAKIRRWGGKVKIDDWQTAIATSVGGRILVDRRQPSAAGIPGCRHA